MSDAASGGERTARRSPRRWIVRYIVCQAPRCPVLVQWSVAVHKLAARYAAYHLSLS